MKNIKLQPLIIGLLVIAAGALLVAFNSGALPVEYKRIVFSWPMLLVAVGFFTLFGGVKGIFGGIALIMVGGIFLLRRMDIAGSYLNGENIWATVLVVAGILIVAKSCFLRKSHSKFCDPEKAREWKEKHGLHCHAHRARRDFRDESRNFSDYLERSCVFGSVREKVESQSFSGGEVNCIFGSVVLDFAHAQLAEGVNYLEINAVFGGVELYLPNDWSVEMRQTCVFGGFVDRRTKATFDIADGRKLILVLNSVFGGGEIKSHA